jgi:hypothetical protein
MLPVPQGTKNAYAVDQYVMVERKEKSKVIYELRVHLSLMISYDSFAHFCKRDKMFFLPTDGKIEIYTDSGLTSSFNLSECTKDSRLFSTGTGIAMWESNKLYLLNTKQ